jgi:hypothetical protein
MNVLIQKPKEECETKPSEQTRVKVIDAFELTNHDIKTA